MTESFVFSNPFTRKLYILARWELLTLQQVVFFPCCKCTSSLSSPFDYLIASGTPGKMIQTLGLLSCLDNF